VKAVRDVPVGLVQRCYPSFHRPLTGHGLTIEPQPLGAHRRGACPGLPHLEAQSARGAHSRSRKISVSFILLKRDDPGIADLLSSLTLWPHDQER
jgi:hypothetical protein